MKKGISVVICSYNSEDRIGRVLSCLMEQKNTDDIDWELLLVDNNSKDNVIEVAKKTWKHPKVPLHVFSEFQQGQSYATKTGIYKAKYEIIVLVDDDNYISQNYLSKAYTIMENHPEVGIAGGKGIGVFEKEPPHWFRDIQHAFAIGPQAKKEGYADDVRGYIYGAGSILRKSVYEYLYANNFQLMLKGRIGKSLVAGEDKERSHAFRLLGYKMWYDPSLEFEHFMPAGRVNWNYTKMLLKSFGHAAIYHNLYKEALHEVNNFKLLVIKYAFFDIVNSTAILIKYLPAYLWVSITTSGEGRNEISKFVYRSGYLSERVFNLRKIKRYRRRLKDAPWRKNIEQLQINFVH